MDDDLISRQTALDSIKNHSYPVRYDGSSVEQGMTLTGIEQALKEAPSIRPEQKTGRWIDYCGNLHCSVCGFRNSDHYCLGEGIACPNCGAFMPDGLKNVLG